MERDDNVTIKHGGYFSLSLRRQRSDRSALSRAGPAFVEIDAPMFIGLLLLSRAKCPQAPRLLEIKIIILYTYLHVYFIPNTKL